MRLRYVVDTFVIWPNGVDKVDDFLQHLNSKHSTTQYRRVYQIPSKYGNVYTGETGRTCTTRLKEGQDYVKRD